MYIDPEQMDDLELVTEIEAAKEELELFGGITILEAEKLRFDPRATVRRVSKRLDQLIIEGSKRGLYRPNFRLV